jgi:threonine dehydratase
MSRLPTADELDDAWTAVRGRMEPSPLAERDGLLWKCETELPTGSFKVRGATVAAAALASDRGLVAASAGNHGLGLCWATAPARTPLTIVVPRECPEVKRNKLAAFDHATIRVCEAPGYDAAEALARAIAADEDRPFVSPFDHPLVMAGNGGTLLRELMEQLPDAGTIIVPVGGGGLLAGLIAARARLPASKRPDLVAVQSEASPAFFASLRDRHAYTAWPPAESVAEGLEGGTGAVAVAAALDAGLRCLLVSEEQIIAARTRLWEVHGWKAEGSAAVVEAARAAGLLEGLRGPVVGLLTGRNTA